MNRDIESIKLQWLLQEPQEQQQELSNTQNHTNSASEYFEILQKLVENKDSASLQELLEKKEYRETVNYKDSKGFTLLHFSALKTDPDVLKVLLEAGAQPNVKEFFEERTPLHLVVSTGCRCAECSERRVKCIELLVNARARLDPEDKQKETPLYYAARNMFSESAKCLLNKGCNLNHWNEDTSVATLLIEYLPDVMTHELNKCVGYDLSDTSKLLVDFSLILQVKAIEEGYRKNWKKRPDRYLRPHGETELLQSVLKARIGKDTLVSHPVIEAFLHFKWIAVQKFFFLLRSVYFFLVVLYTILIFRIYSNECQGYSLGLATSDSDCIPTYDDQIMGGILYLSAAVIMITELYKLITSFSTYFSNGWSANLWWILCAFWVVTLMPIFGGLVPNYWQYPLASVGLIYSWLMTLEQLERIPFFAVHVGLLVKVVQDFISLLISFSTILIAFSLGFCILLPDNQFFNNNFPAALFKVFLMMKGDIDYENVLDKRNNIYLKYPEYSVPAHLLFAIFVIVVTMLLTSLLIGLAVQDIAEIKKQARVNRSIRLIQEIGIFESVLSNRFLTCGLSIFLNKQFSIEKLQEIDNHVLRFSPVHPDDHTLPKDIKDHFTNYMISCPCQLTVTLPSSVL